MPTLVSTGQFGDVDLNSTTVVFGSWVIVRTPSADQIEGWIDSATTRSHVTDIEKIKAAIKQTEGDQSPQSLSALAA